VSICLVPIRLLLSQLRFDPLIQYAAYYNFTVYPGNTYDYSPFNASIESQMYNAMYGKGNCYDKTVDCYTTGINEVCSAADNFCADQVESVLDNIADRDEYDVREFLDDPFQRPTTLPISTPQRFKQPSVLTPTFLKVAVRPVQHSAALAMTIAKMVPSKICALSSMTI